MRIAVVHSGADLYGASRCLLRLASRLVRDGHTVLAILPFDGPLRPALEDAGAEAAVDTHLPLLTRPRFRTPWSALSLLASIAPASRRLERTLERFGPDVIHSNTATVLLSPALAANRLGVPHLWHMREFFRDFPRLWPVYRFLICRYSARIVCVSAAVARQFTAAQRGRMVRVVHDGFPAGEFSPVPAERIEAVRRQWGIGDAPAIGVLGRIKFRRKGQETFVRAAARVAARHPNARFVVVGTPFPGNEVHGERLAALIEDLGMSGKVIMAGEATDIRASHAALDVLVLPSAMPEPFGGVVVEGMGFGTPVIGTNIGGTVEQVEDGVTGWLVPPDDPAAMADAMQQLLDDPDRAAQMGAAGRRRFEERFEFEPFYRKMVALYVETAGLARAHSRANVPVASMPKARHSDSV